MYVPKRVATCMYPRGWQLVGCGPSIAFGQVPTVVWPHPTSRGMWYQMVVLFKQVGGGGGNNINVILSWAAN